MPHHDRSQILDHLGLVAAMFDALGMGEVIDRATRHQPETRIVTTGDAVKAMVRNSLGFVNQQLSLVPRFFQDKPTSRLLAPLLIEAHHLHDAALGRAPRFAHLDRTSCHVDGHDNSGEEPAAQVAHITRGDSREHRPARNHVLREVIIEPQAGLPVLLTPLSGNSRDGTACGQVVREHSAPWHTTSGTTSLVADRALYREANRQRFAHTQITWMLRVPATVSDAQAVLGQTDPQTMTPLADG